MIPNVFIYSILALLIVWEAVLKAIALWKSAQRKQLGWFLAIFIINSAGVLPLIYLVFFSRKNEQHKSKKA